MIFYRWTSHRRAMLGTLAALVAVVLIVVGIDGAIRGSAAAATALPTGKVGPADASRPVDPAQQATPANPAEAAVAVYPAPGSMTASPETQISIRGISPGQIGPVTVHGAQSGDHATTMRPDSDGHGASLYLATPLDPGEAVTVSTQLDIVGATDGRYVFYVSRPVSQKAGPDNKPDDPKVAEHYASAPELAPPKITVTTGSLTGTESDGDIFLAPKSGHGQFGPMILSPTGQVVWFHPLDKGTSAFDFRVQHYQGKPVLTRWQGYITNGHGMGYGVIYNDSYQQIATVHAGNGYSEDLHDFTITDVNTALITVYQPVRWNLSSVGGPVDGIVIDGIAQEIDIPTGNVIAEWHSLDHVALADSFADVPNDNTSEFDYFHINALDLSVDGTLLISSRATHTIFDVSLTTGDVLWRLGGKHSSFTGTGTKFSSQHDAKWIGPHEISLFDNAGGVGEPTAEHSSGMVVRLDFLAHTAVTVQRFGTDTVPRANSQGDLQLLPGGGAFIGWGGEPYLSQFDASGAVIWQAQLPQYYQSYRAYRFDWSGHPTTSPSANASSDGATTAVAMSWNGATAVASWRILAGDSAAALQPIAQAASTGFETTLSIAETPTVVVAQALDAEGGVLGASDPVVVSRS